MLKQEIATYLKEHTHHMHIHTLHTLSIMLNWFRQIQQSRLRPQDIIPK